MPRYDYQCQECTELFEEEHPMQYTGAVLCPVCSSGDTHKLILSAPAIGIWWKDASSSSDASQMRPRFLPATKRRSPPQETAKQLGGV